MNSLEEKLELPQPLDEIYNVELKEQELNGKTAVFKILHVKPEIKSLEQVIRIIRRRDKGLFEDSYYERKEKRVFVLKEEYSHDKGLEEKVNTWVEKAKTIFRGGGSIYECTHGLTGNLKFFYGQMNKFVVKLGLDPTKELHLGHLSTLNKALQLQELGCPIVIILGDYTASIGDPSGASARKNLPTIEEARRIAITEYIPKILRILNPEKTYFLFNTELHTKNYYNLLEIANKINLKDILSKPIFIGKLKLPDDEFEQIAREIKKLGLEETKILLDKTYTALLYRIIQDKNLSILRLTYPFVQGIDSIFTGTLLELGGTDQRENILIGRQLQEGFDLESQIVLLQTLIPGSDGKKMSKSLNNFISLSSPKEILLGIIRMPDYIYTDIVMNHKEITGKEGVEKQWVYLPGLYKLVFENSPEGIDSIRAKDLEELKTRLSKQNVNPRDDKLYVARLITRMLYGNKGVKRLNDYYLSFIKKSVIPKRIPYISVEQYGKDRTLDVIAKITRLSKSDIKRLYEQSAMKIILGNGEIEKKRVKELTGQNYLYKDFSTFYKELRQKIDREEFILQIGKKHFIKIGSYNPK